MQICWERAWLAGKTVRVEAAKRVQTAHISELVRIKISVAGQGQVLGRRWHG